MGWDRGVTQCPPCHPNIHMGWDPDVPTSPRGPYGMALRCHPMSPSVTQRSIWDEIEVSPRCPLCHPDAHVGWDQGVTQTSIWDGIEVSPDVPSVTQMSIWDGIKVSPRRPQCHPEVHMGQDPDVLHVTQMPIWDGIEVSPRCPPCHPNIHMGWDPDVPTSPRCPYGMGSRCHPDVPRVTQMPIRDGIEVSPNVTQCHPEVHVGWDRDVTPMSPMSPRGPYEMALRCHPDVPSVTQMPIRGGTQTSIWDGIEVSP